MLSRKQESLHFIIVNAFVWMGMGCYTPFISAFYTAKGISPSQIGILMALGPLAALLVQPIWASISDKTGKRRMVLRLVAVLAAGAMLLFLAGQGFAYYCFAAAMLLSCIQACAPLSDAIITRRVNERGLNFATVRMGGTVGYAILVYTIGNFLKANPSRMFLFGCVMYLLLALVCGLLPKNTASVANPAKSDETQEPQAEAGKEKSGRKGKIFTTPLVVFVLVFTFAVQFGVTLQHAYIGMYTLELGYDHSIIGFLAAAATVSEIPVLLVVNRIIKKFNIFKLLLVASGLMVLRMFLMTGESLPIMIISQLLNGLTYMLAYYSSVIFVSQHVMPGRVSQGQSMVALAQTGLGAMCANLLGGVLVEYVGLRMTFVIAPIAIALVVLVNMLVLAVVSRRWGRSIKDEIEATKSTAV